MYIGMNAKGCSKSAGGDGSLLTLELDSLISMLVPPQLRRGVSGRLPLYLRKPCRSPRKSSGPPKVFIKAVERRPGTL